MADIVDLHGRMQARQAEEQRLDPHPDCPRRDSFKCFCASRSPAIGDQSRSLVDGTNRVITVERSSAAFPNGGLRGPP